MSEHTFFQPTIRDAMPTNSIASPRSASGGSDGSITAPTSNGAQGVVDLQAVVGAPGPSDAARVGDPWEGGAPHASIAELGWRGGPALRLVMDASGAALGLAAMTPDVAESGRDADPVAPDPNLALRDAMAMVDRALEISPDLEVDAGAGLRARVGLLEELVGLTTTGLAATLASMRRVGAIEADGASSTAAWVRAHTLRSGREAARAGRLADNLDALPATAEALASGQLTAEAADAMVQAARDGRMGGPEQVERELLSLATSGPPEQLRAGIRRKQQAVDAAAMLRDERRQHVARRIHFNRRDSGMWGLHGELPDEVGQQLATLFEAFDHPEPAGTPLLQRRRPEQRRADALAALVGVALDRGFAPGTGGIVRPHISVIVPAPTFTSELGTQHDDASAGGDGRGLNAAAGVDRAAGFDAAAGVDRAPAIDDSAWAGLPAGDLDWGGRLSPQAVRRICCDADVTRIIMTPDSQVLDVGRATRVWSQPQRRAVNARDRHCRGPSCSRPIGWTQIHHIRWWQRDRGPTDLDNGIALCTHCHQFVHDRGWTVTLDPATSEATWTSPTGVVTVTRPPDRDIHEWKPARPDLTTES